MKNKAKIAALILVLSVFVLTTVFLFSCRNETDKKEGIDTTTPESTAATSSPEVTTAPKSETTAPETTVAQTDGVTTALPIEKTLIIKYYTCYNAKETDVTKSGYDIIDTLGKYTDHKAACMNNYTDGKKVFEEFESAIEFDGTQDFFDKYYIISVSARGFYYNGYTYGNNNYPTLVDMSIKKDSVEFDFTKGEHTDKISPNGNVIFRTFFRIEKKYYRDNVKMLFNDIQSEQKNVSLPYAIEQSAMLFDESDGRMGQTPLNYALYQSPQELSQMIALTRVEGVWENKHFDKTVQDIVKKYDEKFFETHVIIALSVMTPEEKLFRVENLSVLGDHLYIDVRFTLPKESTFVYDMVREKVYTLVEVAKKDLPEAIFKDFYINSTITVNYRKEHLDTQKIYCEPETA